MRRLVIGGVLSVVIAALIAVGVLRNPAEGPVSEGLRRELEGRGRVLVLDPELSLQAIDGVEWVQPEPFESALASTEAAPLLAQMRAESVDAILVRTGSPDDSLVSRFATYEHIPGFVGVYLDTAAVLYAPGLSSDLGESARLTPAIARRILEGAPAPRVSSFPEPLRRIQNVEVMVLLRDRGRARLWRSARGSSIARALVTACTVARQRWRERERALGGPLVNQIDQLRVEVSLLEEDGTLGTATPAFVERVFKEEHGVAYAVTGAWRYLLPDATAEQGGGSAVAAYDALFRDNALPEESLGRADMRFYRLVVTTLGTGDDDGISPIGPSDSPESAADSDSDDTESED